MANVKKTDRVQNTDIKRLNHVGLSLKAIADLLGCHAATVTTRLKEMGLRPFDTRRSFMEKVFLNLTTEQQDWLSNHLFNNEISVADFVTTLVREAYESGLYNLTPVAPELPEMFGVIDPQSPPTEEQLAQLELELKDLPTVPAEVLNEEAPVKTVDAEPLDDGSPNPPCGECGEAPEMTGQGICPGCLDAGTNQPENTVVAEEPVAPIKSLFN